jgi:TPR repeat protein
MYEKGEGVNQDKGQAVQWYRKAAEQGYANAQYNLGVIYDKGDGVSQDKGQAVQWYRIAAKQGNVEAKNRLAYLSE